MAHTASKHDRGIRPELIAPRGAIPVGVHLDGRTIYEQERFDIKATVDSKTQVLDPATGKKKWRKHPTTGESLYPIMKTKAVYNTVRFVLDRSPRGKVSINPFFEGSNEERDADARKVKAREFSEKLAELAADRGVDPESVINKVMEEAAGSVQDALPYPQHKGGGHWLLSDLTTMRGSRDEADIAEAAIHIEVPVDEESY